MNWYSSTLYGCIIWQQTSWSIMSIKSLPPKKATAHKEHKHRQVTWLHHDCISQLTCAPERPNGLCRSRRDGSCDGPTSCWWGRRGDIPQLLVLMISWDRWRLWGKCAFSGRAMENHLNFVFFAFWWKGNNYSIHSFRSASAITAPASTTHISHITLPRASATLFS